MAWKTEGIQNRLCRLPGISNIVAGCSAYFNPRKNPVLCINCIRRRLKYSSEFKTNAPSSTRIAESDGQDKEIYLAN